MLPSSLVRRPLALLLDAGDTLIFMDGAALSAALADLGEHASAEHLEAAMLPAKRAYQAVVASRRSHENGWNVLVRTALVHVGIEAARAEQLLPALRAVHDEFYFWRKPPPDLVPALVQARQAGMRLAVVSNSEGRLSSVLSRVGLLGHFELVVDSQLEGVAKPDPEIFRRALARMDVSAERALYAGDIPEVDVDGARLAGMHGVLVDAFDHYANRPELPRVRSVAQLVSELLALPA